MKYVSEYGFHDPCYLALPQRMVSSSLSNIRHVLSDPLAVAKERNVFLRLGTCTMKSKSLF